MSDLRCYINIVEGTKLRQNSPAERLMKKYGRIYSWADLPKPGKKAVQAYHVNEHGFDVRDTMFWYGLIPTKELIRILMRYNPDVKEYSNFEDYHSSLVYKCTR